VGTVSADALRSGARRGFEPAIVCSTSKGFAVWVRHTPVIAGQLPELQRAARLAYGVSPQGPVRPFGPLATGPGLLHVSDQPYSRAAHLATALANSRSALDKTTDSQLRAHGVPSLASPRQAKRSRQADQAWLRQALARRLPARTILRVLTSDGARSQASALASARYALSSLTAATPHLPAAAVARSLSIPTSYLQPLVKAVRIVRHFL